MWSILWFLITVHRKLPKPTVIGTVFQHHHYRLYSSWVGLDLLSWGFITIFILWSGVVSLTPNPPNMEGQGITFNLGDHPITLDLSGMGGSTSSVATTSIALRIMWPHRPHHYIKTYCIWRNILKFWFLKLS